MLEPASKEIPEDIFEASHVGSSLLFEAVELAEDVLRIEALAVSMEVIVVGCVSFSGLSSLVVHLPLGGIRKDLVSAKCWSEYLLISVNFSLASAEGFLSGWYSWASL